MRNLNRAAFFMSFALFILKTTLRCGKEVGFLFGFVQEAELFVDEGLDTDAADGFRLVQHLIVECPFHFVFGMGVNVDSEIFPAAQMLYKKMS